MKWRNIYIEMLFQFIGNSSKAINERRFLLLFERIWMGWRKCLSHIDYEFSACGAYILRIDSLLIHMKLISVTYSINIMPWKIPPFSHFDINHYIIVVSDYLSSNTRNDTFLKRPRSYWYYEYQRNGRRCTRNLKMHFTLNIK